MHLAVDTCSELPIAVEVTPAHVNDGDVAPDLMAQSIEILDTKPQFFIMDAGYDQHKNDEFAHKHGAQAIIPLNLRNEKEPPAGMMSNGTPRCSMGYEMTYWGADPSHLKFRCPHATGKVDCPLGMAACSSSNYGMVAKVRLDDDLRRYSKPHRDTRQWKTLYDERTSVERCNSRMKTFLTANSLHVWGIKKVQTHISLNVMVLLVSALAVSKQKQEEQLRKNINCIIIVQNLVLKRDFLFLIWAFSFISKPLKANYAKCSQYRKTIVYFIICRHGMHKVPTS